MGDEQGDTQGYQAALEFVHLLTSRDSANYTPEDLAAGYPEERIGINYELLFNFLEAGRELNPDTYVGLRVGSFLIKASLYAVLYSPYIYFIYFFASENNFGILLLIHLFVFLICIALTTATALVNGGKVVKAAIYPVVFHPALMILFLLTVWMGISPWIPCIALIVANIAYGDAARNFLYSALVETHADAVNETLRDASGAEYLASLFRICGMLAKTDGQVSQSEIDAATEIMDYLSLDEKQKNVAMDAFREGRDGFFKLDAATSSLRDGIDTDGRQHMFYLLWSVAVSNGHVSANEFRLLESICEKLALPPSVVHEAKSSYEYANTWVPKEHYETLGVSEEDSLEAIKRKYKQLAAAYHPDYIQSKNLAPGFLEFATKQMGKINLAYAAICKAKST